GAGADGSVFRRSGPMTWPSRRTILICRVWSVPWAIRRSPSLAPWLCAGNCPEETIAFPSRLTPPSSVRSPPRAREKWHLPILGRGRDLTWLSTSCPWQYSVGHYDPAKPIQQSVRDGPTEP